MKEIQNINALGKGLRRKIEELRKLKKLKIPDFAGKSLSYQRQVKYILNFISFYNLLSHIYVLLLYKYSSIKIPH